MAQSPRCGSRPAPGATPAWWIGAGWGRPPAAIAWLVLPAAITSVLATCYTGFLFRQGLARDLWPGLHPPFDLLVQAVAGGAAALVIVAAVVPGIATRVSQPLTLVLIGALVLHLV